MTKKMYKNFMIAVIALVIGSLTTLLTSKTANGQCANIAADISQYGYTDFVTGYPANGELKQLSYTCAPSAVCSLEIRTTLPGSPWQVVPAGCVAMGTPTATAGTVQPVLVDPACILATFGFSPNSVYQFRYSYATTTGCSSAPAVMKMVNNIPLGLKWSAKLVYDLKPFAYYGTMAVNITTADPVGDPLNIEDIESIEVFYASDGKNFEHLQYTEYQKPFIIKENGLYKAIVITKKQEEINTPVVRIENIEHLEVDITPDAVTSRTGEIVIKNILTQPVATGIKIMTHDLPSGMYFVYDKKHNTYIDRFIR